LLQYTTQEILTGILENNSIVIRFIYDQYLHGIRKFIEKFGGSKDDALDVFQEGILVIYEQIKRGEVNQIKNFRGYLFSICKYKWYNMIRDNNSGEYTTVEMEEILPALEFKQISEGWTDLLEKERRVKIYFRSFMELSGTRQMMVRYVAYGWAIEDIAAEMNFSVTYTYRKRQACLNKLIELVKQKLDK
jgi:RNA polymerase sigma factor (sigma-70 family)